MGDLLGQPSPSNVHPVSPYPNNTNVANFVNIKLNTKIYLLWKDQNLNLIDSHGFRPFINGTIGIPPKNVSITLSDVSLQECENSDYVAWNKSDKPLKS